MTMEGEKEKAQGRKECVIKFIMWLCTHGHGVWVPKDICQSALAECQHFLVEPVEECILCVCVCCLRNLNRLKTCY